MTRPTRNKLLLLLACALVVASGKWVGVPLGGVVLLAALVSLFASREFFAARRALRSKRWVDALVGFQRFEQQLCLKSTGLARTFGPAVIKDLAITGNDLYLREGSDFTIIFHLSNKSLFKTGSEPALAEAKKRFAKTLKETKAEHQGITIESFVTPLREVSLHRAYFDDVAVFSNSGVALRRVIDAHKGKIKRLNSRRRRHRRNKRDAG